MLSPRLPITPQTGQWILSGSCPRSRAVATACVSCPGFQSSMSVIVNPPCPALRIVLDSTEAWRLAAEAGPKRQRGQPGGSAVVALDRVRAPAQVTDDLPQPVAFCQQRLDELVLAAGGLGELTCRIRRPGVRRARGVRCHWR